MAVFLCACSSHPTIPVCGIHCHIPRHRPKCNASVRALEGLSVAAESRDGERAMLACALGGLEGLHVCAAPGQMHAARPARCMRGAGPAMQIGAELGNGELTYPFGLAARVGRDTYSDEWEEEEAYTPQVCHTCLESQTIRRHRQVCYSHV